MHFFFFFQAEDGIRDGTVTGVQTCALPIFLALAEPEPQGPLQDVGDLLVLVGVPRDDAALLESHLREHDPLAGDEPAVQELRQVFLRHVLPAVPLRFACLGHGSPPCDRWILWRGAPGKGPRHRSRLKSGQRVRQTRLGRASGGQLSPWIQRVPLGSELARCLAAPPACGGCWRRRACRRRGRRWTRTRTAASAPSWPSASSPSWRRARSTPADGATRWTS